MVALEVDGWRNRVAQIPWLAVYQDEWYCDKRSCPCSISWDTWCTFLQNVFWPGFENFMSRRIAFAFESHELLWRWHFEQTCDVLYSLPLEPWRCESFQGEALSSLTWVWAHILCYCGKSYHRHSRLLCSDRYWSTFCKLCQESFADECKSSNGGAWCFVCIEAQTAALVDLGGRAGNSNSGDSERS